MGNENILSDKLVKLLFLIKFSKIIEGKTKLHKMIFLGKEEENLDMGFTFEKYNYGPYSFELTEALNSLESLGLIEVQTAFFSSSDSKGFQTKQFTYKLSDKGVKISEEINLEKFKEVVDAIKKLVEKWNNVSRQKIVEHVYSKYM
jgi:uncharacterized protein